MESHCASLDLLFKAIPSFRMCMLPLFRAHAGDEHRMATDSLLIRKMCGTRNGRLFLCGEDGHLYEFQYDPAGAPSGGGGGGCFRRRKARKTDHSGSGTWSDEASEKLNTENSNFFKKNSCS